MDLQGKKIAVFGAAGSIGRVVCKKLAESGGKVFAAVRHGGQGPSLEDFVAAEEFRWKDVDVMDIEKLNFFVSDIRSRCDAIDGLVYAVGHCPPHGLEEEISTPISALQGRKLRNEIQMHVFGLLNVFQACVPILSKNAKMVVVGSAITRLTDGTCPSWLFAGHYAAATAAKDELIRWMRRDPEAKARETQIYRLAFGAIDTPFHEGSIHCPPAMLSLAEATEKIIFALQGEGEFDQTIVAPPPAK